MHPPNKVVSQGKKRAFLRLFTSGTLLFLSYVLPATHLAAQQQIDYLQGFPPASAAGLLGAAKIVPSNSQSLGYLLLTDGNTPDERGGWFTANAFGVEAFWVHSILTMTGTANGMAFVIRDANMTAGVADPTLLGAPGSGLGYGIDPFGLYADGANDYTPNSIAIKFSIWEQTGIGNGGPGSATGLYYNGAAPIPPDTNLLSSNINLGSGDLIEVYMAYDGTTLAVSIQDLITKAHSLQLYTVNIPSYVGGQTARFGFTGGTGTFSGVFEVLGFALEPATIATAQQLVNEAVTDPGILASLNAKLDGAAEAISRNDTTAAANKLQAFINEVNAQSGKGVPVPWVRIVNTSANAIITELAH